MKSNYNSMEWIVFWLWMQLGPWSKPLRSNAIWLKNSILFWWNKSWVSYEKCQQRKVQNGCAMKMMTAKGNWRRTFRHLTDGTLCHFFSHKNCSYVHICMCIFPNKLQAVIGWEGFEMSQISTPLLHDICN